MEFTGERLVLGACDPELEMEHLTRYYFATQFIKGKRVLDAACGTGYGSGILGQTAASVTGIDIDAETVDFAHRTYGNEHVQFLCSSVEELPREVGEIDVAISFETIEHLTAGAQHYFLSGVKNILAKDGLFIVSTPNKKINEERGENEFHLHELELSSFKMLLESYFPFVKILPQMYEVCNTISIDSHSSAMQVNSANMEVAEYFIAICSMCELPIVQPISWVRTDGKYRQVLHWAIDNHNTIQSNNAFIEKQQQTLNTTENHLREVREREDTLSREHDSLCQQHESLCQQHDSLCQQHDSLCQQHDSLSQQHDSLSQQHDSLCQQHDNLSQQHDALSQQHDNLEQKYKSLNRAHDTLCKKHNELCKTNDALNINLEDTTHELLNKQGHIELLLESERKLQAEIAGIHNSKTWRLMKPVWKVASKILPPNSKRRLFVKLVYKAVRHPIRFIRNLTPYHIKTFFKVLKREGAPGVSRRLDNVMRGKEIPQQLVTVTQVELQPQEEKKITDYSKLKVPQFAKPLVSIVIPVYNQFEYTYHCINSIIVGSGDVPYEILVANDCSTDLTTRLLEIISGVRLITNAENLRFLKNCNNAAKQAMGDFILFLNNDTQVQENWLAPLVELMERDSAIGMVGSKLIYPDGRLQEAGGIVWNDSSAWNYGHLAEPEAPEFNYVKEVDYISGAAIMIRRSLWEEIGGFDERFVPAYYEDTDLAFEVRGHGYKVMYQPLSVVVHFEGASNGTDLSSGQKAYQAINQKKFFEKWKDTLELGHFPNAEHVFWAKDRSRNKKTVLVVDHYVPHFDKDAGGRCTFMYVQLFVELGMKVVFVGDNFFPHQPYTQVLQQMGVEVLYGNYYYNNIKDWLKQNAEYFDYAYLNRPHISEKYMDLLKEHTKAKIIYFGHDLHYLRELRQYEIEKDPALLKSSESWKKREMKLFSQADAVFAVGSFEQQTLQQEFPEKPVYNIPVYVYDGVKKKQDVEFSQRQNILFVGGFGHPPNMDAVLWFHQEVFPSILEKYPQVKWYIVGSNPPEEVLALQSEQIIVTGFISDEELTELYETSRMAVVPLRFGAGVKGKVVEAIYHRLPLVTTPIGAEGLSQEENAFVVAETATEIKDVVCTLYGDQQALKKLADNCDLFISRYFTRQTAEKIVLQEIDLS